VIVDDFLGLMFVGGLVGTVIGLVPLEFLPGWALRQWHRGVWAALFALASSGVVDLLLLNHHRQHASSRSSIVTTVVLFVLFAGGSVVFREHFIRMRRAATDAPQGFLAKFRELISPAPPAIATPAPAPPVADAPAS
jgi:hypothetical protein